MRRLAGVGVRLAVAVEADYVRWYDVPSECPLSTLTSAVAALLGTTQLRTSQRCVHRAALVSDRSQAAVFRLEKNDVVLLSKHSLQAFSYWVALGVVANTLRNFLYDIPFIPIRHGCGPFVITCGIGFAFSVWEFLSLAEQIRKTRDPNV